MLFGKTISLDGKWDLCGRRLACTTAGFPVTDEISLSATVPGDVLCDLIQAGMIKDPLIRNQHKQCSWVGQCQWSYEKRIRITAPTPARVELVFDGLMQKAKIFWNGKSIGIHNNMHRQLRIDITKHIMNHEENVIRVDLDAFDLDSLNVPDIEWFSGWSDAIYDPRLAVKRGAVRKADYTYGWDWCQGLPVCGIWRSVRIDYLEAYDIKDIFWQGRANGELVGSFQIEKVTAQELPQTFTVHLRKYGSTQILHSSTDCPVATDGQCQIKLQIANPELWYPAGVGAQPLYEAEIVVTMVDGRPGSIKTTFGFRDFNLTEKTFSDKQGYFGFCINGKDFFACGANWVPPDIIPARSTLKKLESLLHFARDCGLNYLRIWGGGIYECQEFYQWCDQLGILVWQDFMFGGTEIPEFDPAFCRECSLEAEYQLKRLRNHPSVCLWCGSNETDVFYEKEIGPRYQPRLSGHYHGWTIFHEMLPRLAGQLAPDAVYLPSDPASGAGRPRDAIINAVGFGSCHTNLCQQYGCDTDFERGPVPAFLNEFYGFSPVPESSWRKFLDETDLDSFHNPVFSAHSVLDTQRNNEWRLFADYLCFDSMSRRFEIPLLQVFAMFTDSHTELLKRYLEYLRRNRDCCGGSALWMFDSAYPEMDLSLVDYYGTPKPSFYAAKRANAPLLPVIAVYDDRIDFHLSNLTRKNITGRMTGEVVTFYGRVVCRFALEYIARADSSGLVRSVSCGEYKDAVVQECFVNAKFVTGDTQIQNQRFLCPPRELRLPEAAITCRKHPDIPQGWILQSPVFARCVTLTPYDNTVYPDDYAFDLLPGEEKIVTFNRSFDGPPQVACRNRVGRQPYVCGREVEYTAMTTHWRVTVFNPQPSPATVPVALNAPEWLQQKFPTQIELAAGSCGTFQISLHPRLDREWFSVAAVNLIIGSETVLTQFHLSACPLDHGKLDYTNRSDLLQIIAPLQYRAWCRDGRLYQKTMPLVRLEPDESLSFDFAPPGDIQPQTASLFAGDRCLCRFWDNRVSADAFWQSLSLQPLPPDGVEVFPLRKSGGDLFGGGHGYLITEANAEGFGHHAEEIKAALFLHCDGDRQCLTLDVLVKGAKFMQRYDGEEVFRDACCEFVLGHLDNPDYRDYSLALTESGPELFLRRGGNAPGLRKQAEKAVLVAPDGCLTYYHICLNLGEEGIPDLLSDGRFRFAMCIRAAGERGLAIYNGIDVANGTSRSGYAKIMLPAPALSKTNIDHIQNHQHPCGKIITNPKPPEV